MIFCNDLKLSISSKTLNIPADNKKLHEVDYYNNGKKIFVKFDHKDKSDQADNIIKLLCENLLKDRSKFSIVKAIFNAKDINEVKKTFKNNGPSFQNFEDRCAI